MITSTDPLAALVTWGTITALFTAVAVARRTMLARPGAPLDPDTRLDAKTMALIGLAVAAQLPCSYCAYGHTALARLNGATDEEIREAVALAAVIRHWSTMPNGRHADLAGFKDEIEAVVRHAEANARKTVSKPQ